MPVVGGKYYLGIDPGASGGLAIIDRAGVVVYRAEGDKSIISMPRTEADIWEWLCCSSCHFAVIERVGGYISGERQPGSAMFKFGMSYGGLRMALVAAGIPFEEVIPRTWQKGLGIVPRHKDESKTQWKNRLKAKAQQLFPREQVTLATADALLIAEFCRRKQEGKL